MEWRLSTGKRSKVESTMQTKKDMIFSAAGFAILA